MTKLIVSIKNAFKNNLVMLIMMILTQYEDLQSHRRTVHIIQLTQLCVLIIMHLLLFGMFHGNGISFFLVLLKSIYFIFVYNANILHVCT